jgi:hypothetical protein
MSELGSIQRSQASSCTAQEHFRKFRFAKNSAVLKYCFACRLISTANVILNFLSCHLTSTNLVIFYLIMRTLSCPIFSCYLIILSPYLHSSTLCYLTVILI